MQSDAGPVTFKLSFEVADLVVDDPVESARAGEDFSAVVDAKAIKGTRNHMLSASLLDADQFPVIEVRSRALVRDGPDWLLDAHAIVVGWRRPLKIPLTLTQTDNRWIASGSTRVSHTELRLTPSSAALGALKVEENLTLSYEIIWLRKPSADSY